MKPVIQWGLIIGFIVAVGLAFGLGFGLSDKDVESQTEAFNPFVFNSHFNNVEQIKSICNGKTYTLIDFGADSGHEPDFIHGVELWRGLGSSFGGAMFMLVLCGTNGNSFEAVQTCMSLITDSRLPLYMNFIIVPMANPEGYDYALTVDKTWIKTRRESKEGCIGVNLNRNFNNDFEQGSGPCSDNDYPGEESNSEPETLAISDYVQIYQWDALIVINTAAESSDGPELIVPTLQDTNFYRKMEMRLRKAFKSTNVRRAPERHGNPIEWAIEAEGTRRRMSYGAELNLIQSHTSLETNLLAAVELINHLSQMIKNEREIDKTYLDTYVWEEDDSYSYRKVAVDYNDHSVTHQLNLTSVKWLNETLIDRSLWTHDLHVIIPHDIKDPTAMFLHITWGDNDPIISARTHSQDVARTVNFAENTGIISAVLKQVPNQPIKFVDADPLESEIYGDDGRQEDGILAKTWGMFIDSYNNENVTDHGLLVHLAMTKSAVRGLDAMTEFIYNTTGHYPIKAGLTGASKRALTSWLAAAVDYERVVFIAPVMYDILNLQDTIHHHFRSFGGYTYTFFDYWHHNITANIDTAAMAESMQILDMINFADRYAKYQVTYIVNAANDQFMLLSNPLYYMNMMSSKTLLRILPNQGHGGVWGAWDDNGDMRNLHSRYRYYDALRNDHVELDRLWTSIESLFMATLTSPHIIPEITTKLSSDGSGDTSSTTIEMTSSTQPNLVRSWQADTNNNKREWRRDFIVDGYKACSIEDWLENEPPYARNEKKFEASDLPPQRVVREIINTADFNVTADANSKEGKRWRGGYIDMEFDLNGRIFIASSLPGISPSDTWISENCVGFDECRGCMV